jgi:photosystem II stability/assembly factor-like uncharacterized protein
MRKQLLLILAFISLQQTIAQITPTPLNLSLDNGFPVYISPVSHDTVWAGIIGINSSAWINIKTYGRTTDAGFTWSKDTVTDSLDRGIVDFFALNGSVAWAVMGDFNGINPLALFTTADGGNTWTSRLDSAFALGFFLNSIYFFSADSGIALGDPNGGYFEIYNTVDAGATWLRVPSANIPASLTNEYGVNHGYCASGDRIWFSTNTDGRIMRSYDRGYTWSVSSADASWFYTGVAFSDSMNGAAWLDNNTSIVIQIYTTIDGGGQWNSQAISPPLVFKQASEIKNVPGAFIFTAGSPAHLYATDDNFSTYFLIDQNHAYADVPFSSPIKMFDASLGWAADIQLSDSAIYKLENLLTGFHALQPASNLQSLNIFPNPVSSGAAVVSFSLQSNSSVVLTLTTITGAVISQQEKEGARGNNVIVYSFNEVAQGLYLLNLTTDQESVNIKVVIE